MRRNERNSGAEGDHCGMRVNSTSLCCPHTERPAAPATGGLLRAVAAKAPRPARFITVGGLGLLTDITSFTLILAAGIPVLVARVLSISIATLVTWRLNRTLTFDRSGRQQHREAVRYAIVTAVAQGTSYLVFAALTLTVLGALPQLAIMVGSAIGAFISYNGHRLFAFAPVPTEPESSPTIS